MASDNPFKKAFTFWCLTFYKQLPHDIEIAALSQLLSEKVYPLQNVFKG